MRQGFGERKLAVLLGLLLLGLPVAAAAELPPAVADGAKKEGEIALYGAVTGQASRPIGELFEKSSGVKLKHWRGDATEIINRVVTEARAGRNLFDVVLGNEAVMAELEQKGFLGSFDPPAARGFPKQFNDPEHRKTPWRVLPFGINFNTQRLTADQAPKTWDDLLDPKWKGKFIMANPGIHVTTLQFVLSLEKLLGPKWLAVVEGWAKQEPRLTRSLAEGIPALTSGEAPLAISYIKDKFQFAGPIDYVRMSKYLASVSFVAVARKAPHPNAARLFVDFFLGPEPQQIFGNLGEYVFHPGVEHRFKRDVEDDQIVIMRLPTQKEMNAWTKKFREMFR